MQRPRLLLQHVPLCALFPPQGLGQARRQEHSDRDECRERMRLQETIGARAERHKKRKKKKNALPIIRPVNRRIKNRSFLDYSETKSCCFPVSVFLYSFIYFLAF